MSEWHHVVIGGALKLTSGFPFPSSGFSEEEGVPLIRIRDIVRSSIETRYLGPYSPSYVVRRGDVLIGMDGDFNVVRWRNEAALLNQRVLKIEVADASIVDLDFVFYWLAPYIEKVNATTAATTVKHLSTKDVTKASGRIPGVVAQRKIAAILKSVYDAIEATESLIEKHQQIKAGLMRDLFTRGVMVNGNLRPPREAAPADYRKTDIGWIPVYWQVVPLSSVSEIITSGSRGWSAYYSEDGATFIRIGNLTREHPNLRWEDVQKVALPIGAEGARTKVAPGDVLVSITADLGICGVVGYDLPNAYVNQHIALVRPKLDVVNSRFVGHYMATHSAQTRFQQSNDSGAKAGLNLKAVGEFKIPLPSNPREAAAIASTLDGVDTRIREMRASIEKLRAQKLGLMQDLLTGRVRVPLPDTEVTA